MTPLRSRRPGGPLAAGLVAILLAAGLAPCGEARADAAIQVAQGMQKKGPMPQRGPGPGPGPGHGPKAGGPSKGVVPDAPAHDQRAMLRPGPFPWVDMHMHFVPARGNFTGVMEEALALMDQAGISLAVVMPPPLGAVRAPYGEANYIARLKRHPDRFAWFGGGADLNPIIHRTDPAKVTDKVRRDFVARAEAILKGGARGFGEIAVLHVTLTEGHPFEESPADHPLFLALADVAGARGAVISLHIDLIPEDGPTPARLVPVGNPPTLRGNVAAFERLLAHNRKARIVLEHVGADPVGNARVALLERLADNHPNLYFAIRGVPAFAADFHNKMIAQGQGLLPEWRSFLMRHSDRFLYGSDTFVVTPGSTAQAASAFARHNITRLIAHNRILGAMPPDVARKIAIDNPRRLLGLPVP